LHFFDGYRRSVNAADSRPISVAVECAVLRWIEPPTQAGHARGTMHRPSRRPWTQASRIASASIATRS